MAKKLRGSALRHLGVLVLLGAVGIGFGISRLPDAPQASLPDTANDRAVAAPEIAKILPNGRPRLDPLPPEFEVWECDVIVIGGSLGGVAAAGQAMQAGATTCTIEAAPWLGGQISAQGVAAIDESAIMRRQQNFSPQWQAFKASLSEHPIAHLPGKRVADTNQCWVGKLCFPPNIGDAAARSWLSRAARNAPQSRWASETAFKGAEFDATGREIVAVYAVRRAARSTSHVPAGRYSQSLARWYSWSSGPVFEKTPLRLQAPPGKRPIVIDATDTGELVGWAGVPHRLGSDSHATTGELNAADWDNPHCTQAITYPFIVEIGDDGGQSLAALKTIEPSYALAEHYRDFSLQGTPAFVGRSFFHYRRILSVTGNDPFTGAPALGDWTLVNWNPGNDWNWMNPPLVFTASDLDSSGQRQNWLGGLSAIALKNAEDRALVFARWLLETQPQPGYPLKYLSGPASPLGTTSGLSQVPYFREGRRILGRPARGQEAFYLREADLRRDLPGGRNFGDTAVAIAHYDIDIHGCRYRNGEPTGEASSAPRLEGGVRPLQIPLESLIPQEVDNLLIGGKSLAVSHIANAVTRVHYSEWGVGGAAGSTAGWLASQPEIAPHEIISGGHMPALQDFLQEQGLRFTWE